MKHVSGVRSCFLVILTGLLLLAGCRSQTTVATPVAQATATSVTTGADDWARIQASGKLVVGTSADYMPFSFYTNNFMLDGFDVVLAREVGRRLGLEVEVKDFAFEGLLNALQLGQIDMAIAALSVTPTREQVADFTRVYYVGEDALLARADAAIAPIRQSRDMSNYRIGVQTGSVYATWLRSTLVDTGLLAPDHVIAYNDISRAITELAQNQLDLVMLDAVPAEQFARQGGTKIVGRGLNRESLAIAVRKGSAPLRQQLDNTLGQLQVEGFVTKLAAQYLALDPPEVIAPPTPAPPTATPPPVNPPAPTATTTPMPSPTPTPAPCVDGMAYVADLNYDDGGMSRPPVLAPGQSFSKGWRIRNSGTCPWQPSFALVYIGGNHVAAQMGGQPVTIGQVAPVNSVVDLNINLVAPTIPGVYQGIWQMVNGQGVPFGQRIWVGIQIPGPPTPTPLPNADINFWTDRTNIREGEQAILYWRVNNVRAVYVYEAGQPWEPNGVAGEGSRAVWPRRSTVYELRVMRMDNSPEIRQLRIDVDPIQVLPVQPEPVAPIINSFNTNQDQIVIGSCVGLSWDVAGTITQLRLYRSGALLVDNVGQRSYTDCPTFGGPVTYRLEASNGRTARYRDVTVTVLVRQPR